MPHQPRTMFRWQSALAAAAVAVAAVAVVVAVVVVAVVVVDVSTPGEYFHSLFCDMALTFGSPETVEDSEAEEDNSIEDAEQPSGDEDEEGEGESLGGSDEDEADAKADHRYAEADYR